MTTTKKLLVGAAAFMMLAAPAARAATIQETTTVSQVDLPGTQKVNFEAFDLNGDGVLSMREVGEKLFYLFDQDGNDVIDNIEFNKKSVFTIIPMQKQTVTKYIDDQGNVSTTYSYTDFVEHSGLARFAKSPGGLSPADFIGKSFNELDVNHDGVIDVSEWKGAYIASIDAKNRENAAYNK